MPVSSSTRCTGPGPPSSIESSTPCSCARSEPDREPQPGDVHEPELAEVEDDGAAAGVQDGVHAALE
jgi:hypothetical protein